MSASPAGRRNPIAAVPIARRLRRPRQTTVARLRPVARAALPGRARSRVRPPPRRRRHVDQQVRRQLACRDQPFAAARRPASAPGTRAARRAAACRARPGAARNAVTTSGSGMSRLRQPWATPSGSASPCRGSCRARATRAAHRRPVEQRQRHGQRQPIQRMSGREPVLERQRVPAIASVSGNSSSVTACAACRITYSRVRCRSLRIVALRLDAPALERDRACTRIGGNSLVVKARRSLRRRPARPAAAPCARVRRRRRSASWLCARNAPCVASSPRTSASRMKISCAALGSIGAERHRPPRDQRQAVERDALAGDDFAALARPSAGRSSRASPGRRRPVRSIPARASPRSAHTGASSPSVRRRAPTSRPCRAQARPGMQMELDAARALVVLVAVGLDADVAQQTGEHAPGAAAHSAPRR